MRLTWLVGDGDWNIYNSGGANVEFLFATYLMKQPEIQHIDFIDLPFPGPVSHQYPPLLRKIDGLDLHLPRYKITYKPIFDYIKKKLNFRAKFQLSFLNLMLWFKFHGVTDLNALEGKSIGQITGSPMSFAVTEPYLSQFQRQTADYIKKLSPDIIHSMTEIFAPTAAVLKHEAEIPNVTFAVEDWNLQLQNLIPGSIQHAAIAMLLDLSKWVGTHSDFFDKILPVSLHIANFLVQTGYPPSKVQQTFPSPIDLNMMQPIDKEKARTVLNLPLNKRIILSLGRFMERKHYQDLAEILPHLPGDVVLYLKLCSSTSDTARYKEEEIFKRKVKEKKVSDRVIIDNRALKYQDMKNVYSSCDVAVFPFIGEAFGMCASEAMACEKPLILYNSGNFPTFINKNGFLVEPSDLDALKEKILYILENTAVATEMGSKGRQLVEKYDINVLGAQLLNIYQELVK